MRKALGHMTPAHDMLWATIFGLLKRRTKVGKERIQRQGCSKYHLPYGQPCRTKKGTLFGALVDFARRILCGWEARAFLSSCISRFPKHGVGKHFSFTFANSLFAKSLRFSRILSQSACLVFAETSAASWCTILTCPLMRA